MRRRVLKPSGQPSNQKSSQYSVEDILLVWKLGFLSQRPTQLALNSMRSGKAPSFFLNVFLLDHQNYCNRSFRNPVDILAEAPRGHALKLGNKLPLNSLSLSLGPYLCPRSMWASVVGPRAQIPGNTLTRIRVRWNQGLATNRP
jgi:hypothetical protein